MPTITLTVKYVNPPKPGKKRGSIKDTDDQMFGVFPDKLHLFETGKTYEVEYTSNEVGGVVYNTVKSATPLATSAPRNIPIGNGGSYKETSARDAERMFVCSILNAAVQGQQVEFNHQRVLAAVQFLRGIWQQTFGNEDSASLHVPQNNPVSAGNGNYRQ